MYYPEKITYNKLIMIFLINKKDIVIVNDNSI
ncbi:MAG: hypothetical protein MjAS7_2193 [Metallosphaera javensis (ex Sakai et al. 2022)]|nr:MAG: hypothetical protein MjAS7_2193 [Metallosphaera javensis (ex Sakai et al. 2022)]